MGLTVERDYVVSSISGDSSTVLVRLAQSYDAYPKQAGIRIDNDNEIVLKFYTSKFNELNLRLGAKFTVKVEQNGD